MEEKDFAAAIVVVLTEVEGEMMVKNNPIIKVTQGMSFNVTIAEECL